MIREARMRTCRSLKLVFSLSLLYAAPSFCFADGLMISPASPMQLRNSTLQFTATLNKKDVTGKVQWRSSNPTVASITAGGLATLLAPGTTSITAVRGSAQAATTLSVTTAVNPIFSASPVDTNVSAVINGNSGGVKVQMRDNLGDSLTGQSVTIAIGANPPGTGSLSGTLTQITDSTGTAFFSDLAIDWLGTGYTLVATATPSSGTVTGTSVAFNELRVGDVCLGPDTPACGGTCVDADGDGLNDAWETAGGVDLNGDGAITDSTHDVLLTGADPNKPDIFVQYDWMDYAPPGNACSVTTDCTGLGLGHKGETCTGPQLIPTAPASCRYSCNVDSDCTSRSAFPGDSSHAEEKCVANSCVHTHDPSVTAPNALQAVVDQFAAHGINLHAIRGKAQPHSTVVSLRLLSDPANPNNVMEDRCEGGSLASGDAGSGKYAESFYDLKANSSLDKLDIAYHYTIFSHYSGCDSTPDCLRCPESYNPNGTGKADPPVPGQSGVAEISGNDFIVSFGNRVSDVALPENTLVEGGTFMHELGHNLGLHHGGGIDEPCQDDSQCRNGSSCTQTSVGKFCLRSDDINWKPNYLTVMNYRFQFAGIGQALAVGSTAPLSCSTDTDCPSVNYCSGPPLVNPGTCSRLDYSSQTLPTGGNTPGVLDESNTNGHPGLYEPAGLGSGTTDLTSFFDSQCDVPASVAPTDGPVDWSGNGDFLDTNVAADLNAVDHTCGTVFARLTGATDWPELSGLNFTYGFQCTPFGGPTGDGAAQQISNSTQFLQARGSRRTPKRRAWNFTGGELSPQMAMNAHVLFPGHSVKVMIRPGCSSPAVAPGQPGSVQVALFGDKTFDVNQVDVASLRFHGATALNTVIGDVDGDGQPDLLVTFDMAKVKLSTAAAKARLTGWLKNSQAFFGEDNIQVVPSLNMQDTNCR